MKILFILVFLVFQFNFRASGQENEKLNLHLAYTEGAPFYMKYYVTTQFFKSYRLSFSKQTDGRKNWHALYNYPSHGLGFQFMQLGNPATLGNAFSAYYYFEYTIPLSKKLSIPARIGGGIVYVSKIFHPVNNYQNRSIGSHFNAFYANFLGLRYQITQNAALSPFFSFTHYSNAGLKLPNRGINYISAGLSLRYQLPFEQKKRFPVKNSKTSKMEGLQLETYAIGGLRSVDMIENKRFPALVVTQKFYYLLGRILLISAGFDFTADFSYNRRMHYLGVEPIKNADAVKIGVQAGAGLRFDDYIISFQKGIYCYKEDINSEWTYMRLTQQYFVMPAVFLVFSFQTQRHKADHLSLGFGYKF